MIYLVLILMLFLIYALWEYYWIRTITFKPKDFDISKEIPESLKGKRIVFVSDFQFDHKRRRFLHKACQNVIDNVNQLNPDLVLLGGDFIHHKTKENTIIFDYLKKIPAEKIAVLGNHDYRDLDTVKRGLKNTDIRLLVNEVYDYNGLQIIGIDDLTRGKTMFPGYGDGISLLLTHNPDYIKYIPDRVDFALAGHTHGGMVTLFGLYAPLTNSENKQELYRGLNKTEHGPLYTSSGVGGSVGPIPLRFFARPEIIVIEF